MASACKGKYITCRRCSSADEDVNCINIAPGIYNHDFASIYLNTGPDKWGVECSSGIIMRRKIFGSLSLVVCVWCIQLLVYETKGKVWCPVIFNVVQHKEKDAHPHRAFPY